MLRRLNTWRSRFAWLPTRMDSGRLIWLREFEEMQTAITFAPYSDQENLVTRRRLPPERMHP
jgi:hypothetical protein